MSVAGPTEDDFGVPNNMLRVSDNFYCGLGRIAALGAVVELRMSDVVVLWGGDSTDGGKPMRRLVDRFFEITQVRSAAGLDTPDGLRHAVSHARAAMDKRNEVIHSLWPGEYLGWRNRPRGAVPTVHVGIAALRTVIEHLVEVTNELGHYLYSPSDQLGTTR